MFFNAVLLDVLSYELVVTLLNCVKCVYVLFFRIKDMNFPSQTQQELTLKSKKMLINKQIITHSDCMSQLHNAYDTRNISEFISLLTQYTQQIGTSKNNTIIHNNLMQWLTFDWIITNINRQNAIILLQQLDILQFENMSVGLNLIHIILNIQDNTQHCSVNNSSVTLLSLHDFNNAINRLTTLNNVEWSALSYDMQINIVTNLSNFLCDTTLSQFNTRHSNKSKQREECVIFVKLFEHLNKLQINWQDIPQTIDRNLIHYFQSNAQHLDITNKQALSNCFALMCFRSQTIVTDFIRSFEEAYVSELDTLNNDTPQSAVSTRIFNNTSHLFAALNTKYVDLSPELKLFIPQIYMAEDFYFLPRSLKPTVLAM